MKNNTFEGRFSYPQKFLFLILRMLFFMKQIKIPNGFIYQSKVFSSVYIHAQIYR